MIIFIVFSILSIGALAAYFIPPQRRTLRILVSLMPLAAVGALLLRLPLPDSISIPWLPTALFPDPLVFHAGSNAVSFALYFCCLLILIEWTRPLHHNPGRSSRLVIYLLILSGIAACFAANPLAVIIVWALIDFLSFLATLFLKSPVEIGLGGISSSLSHSMGVLAVNMMGNILIVFSLFVGPPGSVPDWNISWNVDPFDVSSVLFLIGILFRMLLVPMLFMSSRFKNISTGTEILMRIVSPAAGLCLLSKIWPAQQASPGVGWGFSWSMIPLAVILVAAGWQWCISSSASARRDTFFLILPGFALLSAIAYPQAADVFLAAGSMLILGGGILLTHIGYLAHLRWMALFPVMLGVLSAGIPFSPISVWSTTVYPGLLSLPSLPVLLPLALCHIFIICSVFRIAFESVDTFPSREPLLLISFSAGLFAGLLAMLFPLWNGIESFGSIAAPVLLLTAGILLILLLRHVQRTSAPTPLNLEKFFRPDWLQQAAVFLFEKSAIFVSGVENFLSGEGAMLWSLGIALLIFLVFRGG